MAPTPVVTQDLVFDKDNNANGTLSVTSSRRFALGGYVLTSHGRVATRVVQSLDFSNRQRYVSAGPQSTQDVFQQTRLSSATTVHDGDHFSERRQDLAFPFTLAVTGFTEKNKSGAQTTTVRQGYHRTEQVLRDGHPVFSSDLTDEVSPSDGFSFDGSGKRTGHTGQRSMQVYFYDDSLGHHDHRTLTAANGVLSGGGGAETGK